MKINVECRDCEFDKNFDLSSKTATSSQVGTTAYLHLNNYPTHRVEVTRVYESAT